MGALVEEALELHGNHMLLGDFDIYEAVHATAECSERLGSFLGLRLGLLPVIILVDHLGEVRNDEDDDVTQLVLLNEL